MGNNATAWPRVGERDLHRLSSELAADPDLLAKAEKFIAANKPVPTAKPKPGREPLIALSYEDFVLREFPEREPLLGEWLLLQSLAMVHAWRGVGKTFFSLEVAYAVAAGLEFLGWKAPTPRKVLYLDGEMPGDSLKQRLVRIGAASDRVPEPGMLMVVSPDVQTRRMPDLATLPGQADVDKLIEPDTKLIIVDSLSSLARRGGRENERESWVPVAEWAMWQRSQGRSVLFVHHAGKDGQQRGTSAHEDNLDISISLCRPPAYEAKDGAVFECRWPKARDLKGKAVEPFEATLTEDSDSKRLWTTKPVTLSMQERVIDLANDGMNRQEIVEELGCDRTTVWRAFKKGLADGKIKPSKDGKK
jgi:hypothetical protein